jgi:fatty acid desaturase
MESNAKLIEALLEKVSDYGVTSFELVKLKALDKTSDAVSSFIPHLIVFIVLAVFVLFINLGLAFWLGDILGKTYFGFLVVAGFYCIIGLVLHFFMHQWLKKVIWNYIIKIVLK